MMPDGLRFGTGRDSFNPLRRLRMLQSMPPSAAATHMKPPGKNLVLDSRHPREDRGADPAAIADIWTRGQKDRPSAAYGMVTGSENRTDHLAGVCSSGLDLILLPHMQ